MVEWIRQDCVAAALGSRPAQFLDVSERVAGLRVARSLQDMLRKDLLLVTWHAKAIR